MKLFRSSSRFGHKNKSFRTFIVFIQFLICFQRYKLSREFL
nr:MAG TPA: hypothetical protein [Caudoviricetes sp.]